MVKLNLRFPAIRLWMKTHTMTRGGEGGKGERKVLFHFCLVFSWPHELYGKYQSYNELIHYRMLANNSGLPCTIFLSFKSVAS